jgi:hypothetical protein
VAKDRIVEFTRQQTYNTIYARLKNLALNMFEWGGLPPGMRSSYIERLLYSWGKAVFFEDKNFGLMVMQAQSEGEYNEYGDWINIRPAARNGTVFDEYKAVGKDQSCVLIRNNELYMPTEQYVDWYTSKLVEIEMSLDSNVKIQKFPFFISADDKNILSLKNIINQIERDTLAIYYDKNIRGNIEILPTLAPFIADKLSDYRHDVWNEAHTFLGINNANTDKRERLVTDEVNANNDATALNAMYMLESRKIACEDINKLFGTSITVKIREVKQNEPVHPGGTAD